MEIAYALHMVSASDKVAFKVQHVTALMVGVERTVTSLNPMMTDISKAVPVKQGPCCVVVTGLALHKRFQAVQHH